MACSVHPSCFPALAYDGARWEIGLLSALLNFDGRDVGLLWHVAGGKQATAEDGCSSYSTVPVRNFVQRYSFRRASRPQPRMTFADRLSLCLSYRAGRM